MLWAVKPTIALGDIGGSLVSDTSKSCSRILRKLHDSPDAPSLPERRRMVELWENWIPLLQTLSIAPASELAQLLTNERKSSTIHATLYPKSEDFRYQRACESLLGLAEGEALTQEGIAELTRVLTPYYTLASPAKALESSRLEVSDRIIAWKNACGTSSQEHALNASDLRRLGEALHTLVRRALQNEERKDPQLVAAARECGRSLSGLVERPHLACAFLSEPRFEACTRAILRFP